MRSFSRVLVLSTAVLILMATMAGSTQVLYRSVEQLGSQSSMVVRGKVAGVQSFWNGKQTKIFTETIITVDESYKGGATGEVRILQLGGTVGNVQVTVHGALRWAQDEEVLLFLEPYTQGTYAVSGFSQGKFHIERDPGTGEAFIRRSALEGAQFVGAPDGGDKTVSIEKVSLERFISQALGESRAIER